MAQSPYEVHTGTSNTGGIPHVPIKTWTRGVPVDPNAIDQLRNVASLPFVFKHIVGMADIHVGKGATIGSVIATEKAIVPAAVGVDLGCGMQAIRLQGPAAKDLPDNLAPIRADLEQAIPVGRASHQSSTLYRDFRPAALDELTAFLDAKHPKIMRRRRQDVRTIVTRQAGTLGGGNHFIELCTDETDALWVMLHSGSRGIGNLIGSYFIDLAKEEMQRWRIHLPDADLAYLPEGSTYFDDYMYAINWAQEYAKANRNLMMKLALRALKHHLPRFSTNREVIDVHHNYVALEHHFGKNVLITRKGAVRARAGDLAIIPGSMGARSFIVRGKGEPQSFHSCAHGAGRIYSRSEAKRRITLEDHVASTAGIECRKDAGVLDESPASYKNIDDVMAAQSDLVEIVHTLRQHVCVKG